MSQTENTVTSSSGAKRAYRKGNPLSDAEKQRLSVARKRASFKEVKVFLEPKYK
ncbi:replication regulatory protein RepA, partial [Escherichia coli]|nr:replication regulatory protein RepA [Escherichia coli]